MPAPAPLRVGLFGLNGHQVIRQLVNHPRATLVATAAVAPAALPGELQRGVTHHDSLDALLADDRVDLVSLCSPRRVDQAQHAVAALRAGKHVYAEKPCALNEGDLDAVLAAARASGRVFHEMAGTVFDQPYRAMRDAVRAGAVGEVVQVHAQKSYPWHDRRPHDEAIDGGLLRQVTIHALRMICHAAGLHPTTVSSVQTSCGLAQLLASSPQAGPCPQGPDSPDAPRSATACALILTTAKGQVATATANYLNPRGTGVWGYETLRIFGTAGMIESHPDGSTRCVHGATDRGPLDTSAPAVDYFDLILAELLDGAPMPLTLDEELLPTRLVNRARAAATQV